GCYLDSQQRHTDRPFAEYVLTLARQLIRRIISYSCFYIEKACQNKRKLKLVPCQVRKYNGVQRSTTEYNRVQLTLRQIGVCDWHPKPITGQTLSCHPIEAPGSN